MSELLEKKLNEMFVEEEEAPKEFHITDDATADWAMRKIQEFRRDTERWKVFYDAQKQAIKNANENTEAYFTGKLQEFFDTVPHKITKSGQHKYSLPTGEMVFKAQAPEYDINDEALLIAWLKNNGMDEYVKVKESVDWAALKKLTKTSGEMVCMDGTGEMLPGIKAIERDSVFTLSIK